MPHRGGVSTDVAGGTVPMVMEPSNTAIPMIRDGRVQALYVSGHQSESCHAGRSVALRGRSDNQGHLASRGGRSTILAIRLVG